MTRLVIVLAALLALAGCGSRTGTSGYQQQRGKGDAPPVIVHRGGQVVRHDQGAVANQPGTNEIFEVPNGFDNVDAVCDGHGHRVYQTANGQSAVFVIADPTCPGGPSPGGGG